MNKIPNAIKELEGSAYYEIDNMRNYCYYLTNEKNDTFHLQVSLPLHNRPSISTKIINESNSFINGFKVVQTANLEYAYVREEDNTLLPYRYDIATNFNKYGLAMVGKDGKVSWIDKDFKYFNATKEEMVKDEDDKSFDGFISISNFSNGDIPLSKVTRYKDTNLVSYLGTDKKLKEFAFYDGEAVYKGKDVRKNFPYYSGEFNDNGYALINTGDILLASGYYLYIRDLMRLLDKKDVTKYINESIMKFEKTYTNFLKDIKANTNILVDNLSINNRPITEYSIRSIDSKKEEFLLEYGNAIFEKASCNNNLAYLAYKGEYISKVIDLDLFMSLLARRGISSYTDLNTNIFYYNTNKHIRVKK